MTIRASSAAEIERLIAHLRHGDGTEREAAVARLRIIGTRALGRLRSLALDETAPPASRVAALHAVEDLDDERARDAALAAAASPEPSVAGAALAVLRPWIRKDAGDLVDGLTKLALEEQRPEPSRAAILSLLAELHGSTVTPLQDRLRASDAPPADYFPLPRELNSLQQWLIENGEAPLPLLHDVVVHARQQEQTAGDAAFRNAWRAVRGTAHRRLGARGSTVALYDLREAFAEAVAPLPLDFLTAIAAIGDASCLEPMAQAWAAAPTEAWWRDRLSATASDLIKRGRLSGRSAVVKRLKANYPGFAHLIPNS